ncbi:pentatricopeptide repeat-containing protein At4g36680, mitochondrial [Rhodamnia argentea]|uniref:Pentatricopeptide repeat-containing protein At4g36680, mitochondrial n=1 Tax=Rhodamnia argentea TaxID=178133 RepID=A0A8B8NNH3_9MYRT|nr:pentatricopeptide repeat-containing protein At4g36680, mitochondrial [Rhodamnia argentea]
MATMSSSRQLHRVRRLSTAAAAPAPAAATTSAEASASASSISISRAKSKLRSEFDPDKALQIYSSVSKHYSSPVASRYAQDLTIRRLAKSRRFADVEALVESHKKEPQITQEPYLCTLIRSYGIAGMFDHAMRTFEQMDRLGTPRTVLSLNALLSACNASKLFDRVPELFGVLPGKYGVSPDRVSYGILVKSYCEAGSPEKGIEVLKEMEKKGIEVTAVTFTTILDSLYKRGRGGEAEKLWEEMVKGGCVLDSAAYNVRIMNAQNSGAEDVKKLIQEMNNAGFKPDTISYNYLMTSYLKAGMMDEAIKVYEELEGNGCKPNAASFRTLIHYLCKNGDYEKGYKIFKESVKVHKIPDFITLRSLVEGLVQKKMTKEAKGLIRTIKKKFPPNFLNAWKKVEDDLGLALVANDTDASLTLEEDKEATG